MRVLMSCRPSYGHYTPMVGLATALLEQGHSVLFATGSPVDENIRRDGFEVESIGLSQAQIQARRRLDATYTKMNSVRRQERMAAFTRSFAAFEVPPRVDDLRRVIQKWRADIVVHESADFAGPLAAALESLPSANHSFGLLVQADVMAASGQVAAEHWVANGLPAPDRGGMYRGLYLDLAPPSLQYPHITTIPSVQALRPVPLPAPIESPPWLAKLGSRALVTVSFGTVYNERTDLFQAVLEGLGEVDADVVVASGRSSAARSLEGIPPNIQLHEWVPWVRVLERSSAVVSHGGASSTLGPLSFGIPLVLIPMGADHFTNADAASVAGAAIVLDADSTSPEEIRGAVSSVLYGPTRSAAERIAKEIAAMPVPAAVVEVLAAAAGAS